jgi:hypothetical protein
MLFGLSSPFSKKIKKVFSEKICRKRRFALADEKGMWYNR